MGLLKKKQEQQPVQSPAFARVMKLIKPFAGQLRSVRDNMNEENYCIVIRPNPEGLEFGTVSSDGSNYQSIEILRF